MSNEIFYLRPKLNQNKNNSFYSQKTPLTAVFMYPIKKSSLGAARSG